VFVYFPAVIALGLAFFHFHLRGAETTWAGLQNFRDALEYRIFWIAVRNTVLYAAVMIPLTVSLALLIAALLTRQSRFYGALRTAVLLPYVTPVVATSIGWLWIFNPQYGVANSALHALGLPELPWLQSTTWALPSVAIYTLWHGLGFDVIVACAALAAVPRQVVEAARVDGAGPWRIFRSVTLPLISPTVFFLVVVTTIGALQTFSQIYALSGGQGGPDFATTTLLFLIYRTAFTYYHFSYGAAMALMLVVLILALTLLQRWLSRRWVFYQ
jgi:ABC-type sugar transport system permease subunit